MFFLLGNRYKHYEAFPVWIWHCFLGKKKKKKKIKPASVLTALDLTLARALQSLGILNKIVCFKKGMRWVFYASLRKFHRFGTVTIKLLQW